MLTVFCEIFFKNLRTENIKIKSVKNPKTEIKV
jgi:hypothetical protein